MIAIIGIVTIILLFVLLTRNIIKTSKKDWDTFYYLKQKCNEVKTKEEIELFHKEFSEKASKIHNELITPGLSKIDGYLRGLYKQYKI